MANADDQYARRQKLLGDADLARQEVELYAPATSDYEAGARALADYIGGLRQVLKREMNELHLQDLPARQEAETASRKAQERADETRSALATARAALERARGTSWAGSKQKSVRFRADTTKARSGLKSCRGQVAQAEEDRSDTELQSAIEAARAALSEQETAIAGLAAQRSDETLPQLKARIGRLERALEDQTWQTSQSEGKYRRSQITRRGR